MSADPDDEPTLLTPGHDRDDVTRDDVTRDDVTEDQIDDDDDATLLRPEAFRAARKAALPLVAARQARPARARSVAAPPPRRSRLRPILLIAVGIALVLGGLYGLRAAWGRPASTSPRSDARPAPDPYDARPAPSNATPGTHE